MFQNKISTRKTLLGVKLCTFVFLMSFFSQGCDCGDPPVQAENKMTIAFITPESTTITEPTIKVEVKDLDGVSRVIFFVNKEKVHEKKYKKDSEKGSVKTGVNIALSSLPSSFRIRVEAYDTLDNKAELSRDVRKSAGFPYVSFSAPNKIDRKHNLIFVGKKFEAIANAKDQDGVKWIEIKLAPQGLKPEKVRQCTASKLLPKFSCKTVVDVSNPKYKEGPLVILATAVDKDDHKPAHDARREVYLDKTGPQIKIEAPLNGQQLAGSTNFSVLAVDQVGVKKVEFFLNNKPMGVPSASGQRFALTALPSNFGAGESDFKVRAEDKLGNISETVIKVRMGCQNDADCAHKPGHRCCTANSEVNKSGKLTGQCFPVQATEGSRCDPCSQPCGKGSDGRLMGCLPGACGRKPFLCRRACNRGNPNRAADSCRGASPGTGRPAEYCAPSDITKINSKLGACALGDNCNPFNQQVCPAGMQPPYRNCCPQGFGCFPADADANICVPEGSKALGERYCSSQDCKGRANCKKGLICTVSVDRNGKVVGDPICSKLCECNSICRALGGDRRSRTCGQGFACVPLVLTNGRVPLPVGACTKYP